MQEGNYTNANVLYVDDLQTNLILFQATFDKDYNIILADSPQKALEILREQKVQVLVTDQRMPEMTGTELLELVAEEFPDIRRFLLTAYTDFETVVEAVNRGHIHGYINKPIKAAEVKSSINNALEIYYLKENNTQILEELAKANKELSNMDSVKTEILRIMSREIRMPLNRILGTIHLLKDKIESTELINVVNILDNSVSRLEQFSTMAEQISLLKSSDHTLNLEEISLRKLCEFSLVESNEIIKEKEVDVQLTAADDIMITGDFDLLISCLVNIMIHALQFVDEKEIITLETNRNEKYAFCEISYAGNQYPDGLKEKLIKNFTGKKVVMDLKFGIELSLAQLIMEAHLGSIEFISGENNKVILRLHFALPDEPAD
jgi:two-component system sensor histidine kinase/response regulator